ncbi:MAG TPA: rhodanese-like domain-containing protein [Planctomycetota bacterium]|nr:rhodanese-like domain-containing protein [Planctomycetota bacterium]
MDETEISVCTEGTAAEPFALVNVESEVELLLDSKATPLDSRAFLARIERQTGGDKHMRVIVYCAGHRPGASTRAARLLTLAGYTDILEYRGGQEIWHSSPHGFRGQPGNAIASGDQRSAARADTASRRAFEAHGTSSAPD